MNFFYKNIDTSKVSNSYLIYGSGIPSEYFNKKNESKNLWLIESKNNLFSDEINLIYCGRLLKSKGIELFIEIAKQMMQSTYIFGEVDLNSNDSIDSDLIRKTSNEFKNINFMGKIINPLLTKNLKKPILIFPSTYGEGLSRSIMEAMCLQIPIICSRNATSGVFNDDFLYISNSEKINDYINCIYRNDHKNHRLKEKLNLAQKICFENYKEESIVNKTIDVYKKIINNN